MARQFCHKRLTETHNFSIRFPLGIKIRPTFTAPHGKGGQRIFKNLLKGQKFNNSEIHRRMKPQTSLIGTDCRIHLHPETTIYMYLEVIIHPGNTKHDNSLRLCNTLKHSLLPVFRISFKHWFDSRHHLFNSLMKLTLFRIPVFYQTDYFIHPTNLHNYLNTS